MSQSIIITQRGGPGRSFFRRGTYWLGLRSPPEGLCSNCAALDFDTIFKSALLPHVDLKNPHLWKHDNIWKVSGISPSLLQSKCTLCRTLGHVCSYRRSMLSWGEDDEDINIYLCSWPVHISVDSCDGVTALSLRVEQRCTNGPFFECAFIRSADMGHLIGAVKLGLKVNFGELRRMIEDCIGGGSQTSTNHDACRRSRLEFPQNAFVIDCRSRTVVPLTNGMNYIALSYVWGRSGKEDSTKFDQVLPKLPQTVEDAIESTKALNYHYLWVDRYCIDQSSHSEKAQQISQMGNIYNSALATICALGLDSSAGLEGVSTLRETINEAFLDARGNKILKLPNPLSLVQYVDQSQWVTRGWTYQEFFLSRRCIFFTPIGAFLVCQATTYVEGGLANIVWPDSPGQTFASATATSLMQGGSKDLSFTKHAQQFQKRNLTFAADALDAFKGLLQFTQNHCYYGLLIPIFFPWRQDSPSDDSSIQVGFNHALLWQSDGSTNYDPAREKSIWCSELPSWTWVSKRYVLPVFRGQEDFMPGSDRIFRWRSASGRIPPAYSRFDMSVSVYMHNGDVLPISQFVKQQADRTVIPEQTRYLKICTVSAQFSHIRPSELGGFKRCRNCYTSFNESHKPVTFIGPPDVVRLLGLDDPAYIACLVLDVAPTSEQDSQDPYGGMAIIVEVPTIDVPQASGGSSMPEDRMYWLALKPGKDGTYIRVGVIKGKLPVRFPSDEVMRSLQSEIKLG